MCSLLLFSSQVGRIGAFNGASEGELDGVDSSVTTRGKSSETGGEAGGWIMAIKDFTSVEMAWISNFR